MARQLDETKKEIDGKTENILLIPSRGELAEARRARDYQNVILDVVAASV